MRALNGGCSLPVAAYAVIDSKGILHLSGMYAEENSLQYQRYSISGRKEDAEILGKKLAEEVL